MNTKKTITLKQIINEIKEQTTYNILNDIQIIIDTQLEKTIIQIKTKIIDQVWEQMRFQVRDQTRNLWQD
jgi:hypothetical protein